MNHASSPFCEHCGAANDCLASTCHFCGSAFQENQEVNTYSLLRDLRTNEALKGRYLIGEIIGQGGMGTVYRAQDLELNDRLVAIKEVLPGGSNAKEAQEAAEAFKQEATLLASLQHPNLPSIFDHFEEGGRCYLVMSLIQGETLESILERNPQGRLSCPEVLRIGQQLCAALSYLHCQRPPIIFRDLKPANIMYTLDRQIYLIDFGVARHFKPGQKKDTIPFGSVGYAPPEQFGKAQTTPRSDIYSLGATLHQLLSGHDPDATPFRFPPLQTLIPTVPAELAEVIAQMLEMDEVKRPANLLVVEQRLQEIASAATSLAPSPVFPLPRQSAKKLPRVRSVSLVLLAIFCLMAGAIGGNLLNISTPNDANPSPSDNATLTADTAANATQVASFTGTSTAITQAIAAMPTPQANALPAPTQISPASGTVFQQYPRTLTLVWNAVPESTSYTVIIYYYQPGQTNCTDGTPYILASDLTSTAYTFDFVGANPGCWRVWAVGTTGNGQKSPLWEFSFTQ